MKKISLEDQEILALRTAEDVSACLRRLHGEVPDPLGVVHPTAVWRRDAEAYVTLRIVPRTPRSHHDFFLLNVARARADAIVTTGRNLRREPELRHQLQGPAAVPEALDAWRRAHGKERPPVSLVLTTARRLDLGHPLFTGATRPVIFTSLDGARRCAVAGHHGIEVVACEQPSLRAALRWLRQQRCEAISIEAGPSTATELYRAPVAVDSLWLSVFVAPELAPELRGGEFLGPGELTRIFPRRSPAVRVASGDGDWLFWRLDRR